MTVTQLTTKADIMARDNSGITFGKDKLTGSPLGIIEARWNVTIPARPETVDAQQRMEALKALRDKYSRHIDFPNLILYQPVDEWEPELNEWVKTATISGLINEQYGPLSKELRRVGNARLNPEPHFDWVMEHIDPEPTADEFTTLARKLGPLVLDSDAAIAEHPKVLADYRKVGLKLDALISLKVGMTFDDLPHRLQVPALFTKITDLPRLERYYTGGHPNNLYTEGEQHAHTTINEHITLCETNRAAYITLLAQGKIPHATLDVARTADEWAARVAELNELGTINQVPDPNKHTRRRGTVVTSPFGNEFHPNL